MIESFEIRSRIAGIAIGTPLIEYLNQRFPYLSPSSWLNRIENGLLSLDGVIVGPNAPLQPGGELVYRVEGHEEPAVPLDFKVLKRCGEILFVHKPAGLPVHRTGRILRNTLTRLLRDSLGEQSWAPLNRLDVETSGILAFAGNSMAAARHAPSIQNPWKKIYLAIAHGKFQDSKGCIDLPLGEKSGDPIRCRMHAFPEGKPSRTHFEVLAQSRNRCLVALRPESGRKHQLRAHLSALGNPIVGDKLYAHEGRHYLARLEAELNEDAWLELEAPHQLLHALHLDLNPNEKKDELSAESWDFPPAFSEGLAGFSDFNLPAWAANFQSFL